MELSKDLLEFIQLLNQHKVEYLIVGGWAVALHGKPRYTKDIDILIRRSPENAASLMAVLGSFGFGSLDIKEQDFLKPNFIIQLGFEPNRIDLLTDIAAVDFGSAYQRRKLIKYKNVDLWFIDVVDLINNKAAAARDQDLVDVKFLKSLQNIKK